MNKIIDLNEPVYEIYMKHPEILDILYQLGLHDIVKPGMINTVGKVMTLRKGATMKRIDFEVIEQTLLDKGYLLHR